MKAYIPVIVGATASGKTDTAVAFAKKTDGEIISADSMQIYTEMAIGTAKPTPSEMKGVVHHLIDCVSPKEAYSVARFQKDAFHAISDILSRKKTPVIAGGTGLYINALTKPWSFSGPEDTTVLRRSLEDDYDKNGAETMWQALHAVDPLTAEKIHPHNKQRLVRALEIYHSTGKPKSFWDEKAANVDMPYHYAIMGLTMPREILYERINRRVDLMIKKGLPEEVKALLDKGYDPELTSLQAIGYKELIPAVKGEIPLSEAVETLKKNTRHFAKRQLTWFRKDHRIVTFDITAYDSPETLAGAMVAHYQKQLDGNK